MQEVQTRVAQPARGPGQVRELAAPAEVEPEQSVALTPAVEARTQQARVRVAQPAPGQVQARAAPQEAQPEQMVALTPAVEARMQEARARVAQPVRALAVPVQGEPATQPAHPRVRAIPPEAAQARATQMAHFA